MQNLTRSISKLNHKRFSTPSLNAPSRSKLLPRLCPSNRPFSTGPASGATPKAGRSLSPLFTGLLVFGVGLTGYGLYGLYGTLTMWPSEIRQDLRSGLLAKRKGNLEDAAAYLARAWDTTKATESAAFGDQARLMTTGVAITLAGVLEESNRLEDAYDTYKDALRHMANPSSPSVVENSPAKPAELNAKLLMTFPEAERLRAISIAYRLGELAHDLKKPLQEEEKWLSWAVEALLKTVLQLEPPVHQAHLQSKAAPSTHSHVHVDLHHQMEVLELPSWNAMHSLAAPFEALGSFYSRIGKIDYAMPLYLQAVSILMPPNSTSSPEDRCKGAQLMGNIAELILRINPGRNLPPEILNQAESWTRKGLETVVTARKEAGATKFAECEVVYAALLYNFGMIRELTGDKDQARKFLNKSLSQATAIGSQEAIEMVQEGLKELETGH